MPLVLFTNLKADAQIVHSWMGSFPEFGWGHVDMSRPEVIDSTYLDITYSLRRRMSARDDTLGGEDLLELQMGRRYNAFFSRTMRDIDIENTREMLKKMYLKQMPDGCLGVSLLFDHASGMVSVDNRLPFSTKTVEYEEPVPVMEWRYSGSDTLTVMGYLCHAASCSYGGREWKVYYTTDIPLPYGPWKLTGAKGLILRACDSAGDYVFEAVGLTQDPRPIERYEWSRKKMTKEEYMSYERNIHENAGAYVRNNNIYLSIRDNSEKGYHRFTEDWSAYYNPLERNLWK